MMLFDRERCSTKVETYVNSKQASYRYKELTTVDIAAEYTVRSKFRHFSDRPPVPCPMQLELHFSCD